MATQKKKGMCKKFSGVPKMWHGLQGAMHFGFIVAFSAPVKIISICPGVQKSYDKAALDRRGECGIAHDKCFVPCITNLVPQISLLHFTLSIGQRLVCQHKIESIEPR